MAEPKVSCICLTYGRVECLEEAIQFFLNQTYKNKELIVVNDLPQQTLIFEHPDVKIFNEKVRFPTLGAKRHYAITKSSGDIILTWDDDDGYLPNHIASYVAAMEGVDYAKPDKCFVWIGEHQIERIAGCFMAQMAYTRKLYDAVGGYGLKSYGEDSDLSSRMLHHSNVSSNFYFISPREITFLFRWANGQYHLSGYGDSQIGYEAIAKDVSKSIESGLVSGNIFLTPKLKYDYDKMVAEFLTIRIKATTNWIGDSHFRGYLSKMTKNGRWGNIELVDSDQDYTLVVNFPRSGLILNPDKTIYVAMEPDCARHEWGKWYNPNKDVALFSLDRNGLEWHIGMDYQQLLDSHPIKTKLMSAIVSDYGHMDGHKLRLDFIYNYLDKLDGFDHFGKGHHINKSYRGFLENKKDGLLPYKYTFNAENSEEPGYFTEKFADAILAECMLFYWGCPDIERWVDPRCFIRLDLRKPAEAIAIVGKAIANNEWEKRLEHIRSQKLRILNELQLLPSIEKLLTQPCLTPAVQMDKYLHLHGPTRSIFGIMWENKIGDAQIAVGRGDLLFLDYILAKNPQINNIVEFGTWIGLTSLFLGMCLKLRGGELHTFDKADNRLDNVKNAWLDNMRFHQGELLNINQEVVNCISKPNTLLFVDNGNISTEVKLYAEYLSPGSLMAIHDWDIEINEARMKSVIYKYQLGQIYQEYADCLSSSIRCWKRYCLP